MSSYIEKRLKYWKVYRKIVSKNTRIYWICCEKVKEWQHRVKQTKKCPRCGTKMKFIGKGSLKGFLICKECAGISQTER